MSNVYEFGWPSSLVAINFPSQGYAALQLIAEPRSQNDQAFVENFGFGLGSNYPLIHGNMLASAGPLVTDPNATHTSLPWWHAPLRRSILDTTTVGTSTVIDRGVYDVMTDKGEITLWIDTVNGAEHQRIPFTVDYTGNLSGAPTPDCLDGRDNLDLGHGPNTASQVDAFLIEVFQRGVLPGATTFTANLLSVINSHTEAGATITHFDRKFVALYLFDLSKIKAAVGPRWKLSFDVPGQNDQIFAQQNCNWSATLSLWKKQKVFPQAPDGTLALPLAKADDWASLNGPVPSESIVPSQHNEFIVDILGHKVLSAKQTSN